MRPLKSLICIGVVLNVANAVAQNTFPSAGNVGIGTTSPGAVLEVKGSSSTDVTFIGDGTNKMAFYPSGAGIQMGSFNNIPLQFFTNNGGAQLTLLTNGNVGIGTTSPAAKLDVNGTVALNNYQLYLAGYGNPTHWIQYNNLSGNDIWNYWENLDFQSYNNGVNSHTLFLSGAGNVGIGTTSPQAKLEINGNLRFTADGSVQTTAWTGVLCGGDYAESMNAAGGKKAYEPGDVLVLTSGAESDVQKSAEPYSTMVAGIYATKPGVIGRRQSLSKDSEELPMAMVGVVPTKVTAENGPIRKGDLLVSSSTPGYAMKGTDRTRMLGAVIGKAMGSLDSGTGVIEVLVTLQ